MPTDQELDESDETKQGAAKRWTAEFKEARSTLEDCTKAGEEAEKAYADEGSSEGLSLYSASVDLKEAILGGGSPFADVKRRFDDADDDPGRVASEIIERVINGPLSDNEDSFLTALHYALKDWLIPGLGLTWHRLEVETEPVPAQKAKMNPDGTEAAPATEASVKIIKAQVIDDIVYWKDFLWSPCRNFNECRWAARVVRYSKKTWKAKFGDLKVPFALGGDSTDKTIPKAPWARVELWEIWDKESHCLYYYVEGYDEVVVPLDLKAHANPDGSVPDQLELPGFWPFPEPLIANWMTGKTTFRPDYTRAQDQYAAVNNETERVALLRDAVDASCVYDQTVGELGQMLSNDGENRAIPALNYKALMEKGGIAACIAWKPLGEIVEAMNVLRELRKEDIELIFQVDGTSDIMRGQSVQSNVTATERALQGKYGAIRQSSPQNRFALFTTQAQRIRAAIVAKHFPDYLIAEMANIEGMQPQDKRIAPQAIELLKSDMSRFHIVVKPETINLADYATAQQEVGSVINMIGLYWKAIGPLVMQSPQMAPGAFKLLTVFLARVKGGEAAEPILDDMVRQLEAMLEAQAKQPPQEDPKVAGEKVKLQVVKAQADADMQKTQTDLQATQAETGMKLDVAQKTHELSLQKMQADVRKKAMDVALDNQREDTGGSDG